MENEKTIEEIFEEIHDANKLQYLKEKLGQSKKDKDGILRSYPSLKFAKYLEFKNKYEGLNNSLKALKEKVDNGDIEAMTEISCSGASHIKKIDSAFKLWSAIGYKNEVEKIISDSEKQ